MAGTNDKALFRTGGYPDGLNNRAQDTEGPVNENGMPTALREAVNVSLSSQGHPVRRPGQTKRVDGVAHSLFPMGEWLLAVVDGELRAYRQAPDGSLTLDAVLATPGPRFCTYATDDFDVYWSNGVVNGRIDEMLGVHPFWVGTPDPVTLAAASTGGLAAGRYEVSVTAVDASGRESGASGPVQRLLAAGQGLDVTLPAMPEGGTRWRVYVTPPDGEVFYQCADLPANAGGYVIGVHTPGAKLETLWLDVIPPAQMLRHGHSRIYAVAGNNVLMWSEPYRLGLMHPDNHVVIGTECTLLEPLGDGDTAGCWVADHKRTYWMGGPDPENWSQIARYPHAGVPGTSIAVPASRLGLETTDLAAYWMAANGTPCIGLPGGQLLPQRESALALPVDGERGASGLMLFDGIAQILTSVYGAGGNAAAASDSADAVVRRRT